MKCTKCQREFEPQRFLDEDEVSTYCESCNWDHKRNRQTNRKNKQLSWIVNLLIILVIGGWIYKNHEYDKLDKQFSQVMEENEKEMKELVKERDHYQTLYMDGDPVEIQRREGKYNQGLFYGSKYYDENVNGCKFDYINLQNASITDDEYELASAYRNGFITSFNEQYSKDCSWFYQ